MFNDITEVSRKVGDFGGIMFEDAGKSFGIKVAQVKIVLRQWYAEAGCPDTTEEIARFVEAEFALTHAITFVAMRLGWSLTRSSTSKARMLAGRGLIGIVIS